MGLVAERRGERIRFESHIQLVPPGCDEAIVARATNLSESGIFVTAHTLCDVGTELLCDVPLADEWIRLKGRVAWVKPDATPGGMGIEFVDLTVCHSDQLRSTLATGVNAGERVRVWFSGMGQPVAARARPTADGFVLETALPFLQLSSDVRFAFDGDEERANHGRLATVSLLVRPNESVPQLAVEVTAGDDIIIEEEAPVIQMEAALPDPDDGDLTSPFPPATDLAAEVTDPTSGPQSVTSGVIDSPARSLRTTKRVLEEQLIDEQDDPYEAPADPAARSYWSLGEAPEEAFWQESRSNSGHSLLWLGAIAMLSLAAASGWYTGFFSAVGERVSEVLDRGWTGSEGAPVPQPVQPKVVAPGAALRPAAPATAAASTSTSAAKDVSIVAPAVSPSPAKEAVARSRRTGVQPAVAAEGTVAARAKAPPSRRTAPGRSAAAPSPDATPSQAAVALTAIPEVRVADGKTVVRIPFSGSVAGSRSYPLAKPDGLALKLPKARAAVKVGDYPQKRGAVRMIWVRRHKAGLQLRFLYRRGARCRLELQASAAELVCKKRRRP